MKKIRLGIIAPSEIALRRFLPSLNKDKRFEYVGVSIASENEWFGGSRGSDSIYISSEREKALNFVKSFGGIVFEGYCNFIKSGLIDAIYIPLPPSLHFKWAKTALENDLHVFVEKPSTTSLKETNELIELAKAKQLALHENYMFVFHSQIDYVKQILETKELGEVRLFDVRFGFPFRGTNDFRYNKSLGGGALFDCGGYTLKLANMLLGDSATIVQANSGFIDNFEVDMYGSATLNNNEGIICNASFGMDNAYTCDLHIWGSEGKLHTNRIFTAPVGYEPQMELTINGEKTATGRP